MDSSMDTAWTQHKQQHGQQHGQQHEQQHGHSMDSSIVAHLQQCMHVCAVQALRLAVPSQLPGSYSCKPRGVHEGIRNQHVVRLVPEQQRVASRGMRPPGRHHRVNAKQARYRHKSLETIRRNGTELAEQSFPSGVTVVINAAQVLERGRGQQAILSFAAS